MSVAGKHSWAFTSRFRRNAYGWRGSSLAVSRLKEAVSEIKKAARKDPVLGAEGAVLFLCKVSPALEHVDSSSGSLGNAVNKAIEALVPIIAKAPADDKLRDRWMEKLWDAVQDDEIPYIELLPEYWGELCVTQKCASRWADEFIGTVRIVFSPDSGPGAYFKGTTVCFSALYKAGRYEEMMALLKIPKKTFWHNRRWGVKALEYTEQSRDAYTSPVSIARTCEEILLSCGMAEEAYERYAVDANQKTTYLATFRAIAKKYPQKTPEEILEDLVESTPGDEGKWFAAARSAGLYDVAIELANRSPCDPRTLTRATRAHAGTEPQFALEAGMAALRWLAEGYGYDITGMDVWMAYDESMKAARNAGCEEETHARIKTLVSRENFADRFVTQVLGRKLGLE